MSTYVISEYLYSLCFLRTKIRKTERLYWTRIDWHETLSHKMSVPLGVAANIQFSYDRNARTFSIRVARLISAGLSVIADQLFHTCACHRYQQSNDRTVPYCTYWTAADGVSCFRVGAAAPHDLIAFIGFIRMAVITSVDFRIRNHVTRRRLSSIIFLPTNCMFTKYLICLGWFFFFL